LGVVGRLFDVMGAWRDKAACLDGAALPCGHFLAEEAPEETIEQLMKFLK
jgi:haloacetate dehalogenase